MNARLSLILALGLLALSCSDSQSQRPWDIDSDRDEDTAQAEFDFGPSCTVPMFPNPNETDWSDQLLVLGVGVTLEDGRVADKSYRPFDDFHDLVQARFVGDIRGKAAIIDAQTYGDFLADGLWYDLYRFDWARRVRANAHEVLNKETERHTIYSTPIGTDGSSSYAVFAFHLRGPRTEVGRPDVYDHPSIDTSLRDFVDEKGIGYVESTIHGGYEVLTVNLELIDEEHEQILRRFIAAHTDDEHNFDVRAVAESIDAQSLPAIPFAAAEQEGLHTADLDTDSFREGSDLFAALQAAPGRIDDEAALFRQRVEDGERDSGLGVRIDFRPVRYQRAQLESTDLSDTELDALDCYGEFLVEAHTAVLAARSSAQGARCFANRAGDDSYADLAGPLERAADRIESRIDACQGTLSDDRTSQICSTCAMPEGASLRDVRELAGPIPMLEQRPLFAQPRDTGAP